MQERFDNNILMYSTHNEGNSVISKRFIKALKTKICTTMTANDSKYYLNYFHKLVDQYNNTYYHSIGKKPVNAGHSALTGKIYTNPKAPKFKVNDRVTVIKYKNIFSKSYSENCAREIFLISSVFKTNSWTYKIKELNGEK